MYIVLSRIESDEKHCLPFLYEKKTANNVFQIYLFFVLLFWNRKKKWWKIHIEQIVAENSISSKFLSA